MEWSQIPVYTIGVGMVASMGLLIFMSGAKGHRILTPRTAILSHRYFGIQFGNYSALIATRIGEDLTHQRIVNHYLQHSNIKTEKELNHKLLRDTDTWLTPEQAKEYGLTDIIETDKKIAYPFFRLKNKKASYK
jgi:ATP-dependent Clp protease protease subunit